MMRKMISVVLVLGMLLSAGSLLSGCTTVQAVDLMDGIQPNEVHAEVDMGSGSESMTDFGVQLLRNVMSEDRNTLISPLSVLYALGMTANGAKAETLQEIETVVGMPREDLNAFLSTYMKQLSQKETHALKAANSIWFLQSKDFVANQDFLQCNADYYGAQLYAAPFDTTTLQDINNWVKEHTDGMIPHILDKIDENAVMYLVNALAFDARWLKEYEEYQVRDGVFTLENGSVRNTGFMAGEEFTFLEDELATGFVKPYKDGTYAFAALLPKEGVSIEEYVASLTGQSVYTMLSNAQNISVYTLLPKFETSYTIELSAALKHMGIVSAFDDGLADFSGMGASTAGPLFINSVLHKTSISVGEKGTKAGAATIVEMETGGANPEEAKEVYLDRPFVYMLIDTENNMPFFIGTMMNPGA